MLVRIPKAVTNTVHLMICMTIQTSNYSINYESGVMHGRHISGKRAKIKGKGVEHAVVVVMA